MSNQITRDNKAGLRKLVKSPSVEQRLQELLGKRTPQFVSTMLQVQASNKLLANASPQSILSSAMVAATLDLPINPNLGFAYIVPYKGNAQFQMGYKGFIQLALRTGQFATINDFVVPHGSLRSFNPMTGDLEIDWEKADHNKPADGYGVFFRLINGFEKVVFWTRERVEAHAIRFSQSYRSGKNTPWQTDFDAMALKTVIKYTFGRYAPLSVEMQTAIASDQAVYDEEGNETYADADFENMQQAQPDFGAEIEQAHEGKGAADTPKKPEPEPPVPTNAEQVAVVEVTGKKYKPGLTVYSCELIRNGEQVITKAASEEIGKAAQKLVGEKVLAVLADDEASKTIWLKSISPVEEVSSE